MSKSSKANSKQKRLLEKRKRKQANKARYEALKQAGQNTKSVRARAQNRNTKLVKMIDHPDGNCGNIACKKCVVITKLIK